MQPVFALAYRFHKGIGRVDISRADALTHFSEASARDPAVVFTRFGTERPAPSIIIDLRQIRNIDDNHLCARGVGLLYQLLHHLLHKSPAVFVVLRQTYPERGIEAGPK